MRRDKKKSVCKYIPSRSKRLHNNLIRAGYFVASLVLVFEFKYAVNTYNKIMDIQNKDIANVNECEQPIIICVDEGETQKASNGHIKEFKLEQNEVGKMTITNEVSEEKFDKSIYITPSLYTSDMIVAKNDDTKTDEKLDKAIEITDDTNDTSAMKAQMLESLQDKIESDTDDTPSEPEHVAEAEQETNVEKDIEDKKDTTQKYLDTPVNLIRCTGYCDKGQTASGEYTRDGILAGKREWLGKKAVLYTVGENNSVGTMLGVYEFKDTGAGIDTDGDGKGDSLKKGTSIDMWHNSEEACYEFSRVYGDYVYMQIMD